MKMELEMKWKYNVNNRCFQVNGFSGRKHQH